MKKIQQPNQTAHLLKHIQLIKNTCNVFNKILMMLLQKIKLLKRPPRFERLHFQQTQSFQLLSFYCWEKA